MPNVITIQNEYLIQNFSSISLTYIDTVLVDTGRHIGRV